MMQDWNTQREALLGRVGEFAKLSPDTVRGVGMMDAAGKNGTLGPKIHELIALADWLHMDRGLLGFGEKGLRRGSDKQIKERAAAYDADEQLLHAIQTLSGAQRKLVRELVTLLAAAGSKRSG